MTIPLGLFVGIMLGARLSRRRPTLRAIVAFRHAGLAAGDPFRGVGETAMTLREIVECVRAVALVPHVCAAGFELRNGARALTARVPNPANVRLADLEMFDSGTDRVIELALALVAGYGPIVATELTGRYVVDGTLDAEALREAQRERIRDLARRVRGAVIRRLGAVCR